MTVPDGEKTCRFYLLRYTPNIVRGEFINIGVLLYDPAEQKLYAPRLLEDFRRVRRMHPWVDLDVLASLENQIETEATEGDTEKFLKRVTQYSNQLELAEPTAVLTTDPEAELDRLFDTYVREPRYPTRLSAAVERSRAWIRSQLNTAFRQAGLWQRLDKRVPVAEFTHPGDRFRFDFAYRRNGERGFLQALTLERDVDRAKVLAYTMERVATRLKAENATASCTAIVEALPTEGPVEVNDTAQLSARILAEQEIALVPVSGLAAFTAELRSQLL